MNTADIRNTTNTALLDNASGPGQEELSEREKEVHASVWALVFMIAEVCLAVRALRDRLQDRGVLEPEDEKLINEAASAMEAMQASYAHVEKGFREKFNRIRYAMENPQEVERVVRENMAKQNNPIENVPRTTTSMPTDETEGKPDDE
jgi:hypothetical protein